MQRTTEQAHTGPSKPAAPWFRNTGRRIYYTIRGGGKPELVHKQKYHQLRAENERRFLEETRSNDGLMKENQCPACASKNKSERFANPVGFEFAVCAGCGTVYMDPVPTDESLGRLYNDDSYTFHWTDSKAGHGEETFDYENVMSLVGQRGGEKLRLLDVGCASGGFLEACRHDFEADGVELNAETAQLARDRGFDVTIGTLQDVDREGYYDVITMRQLVEHITEPVVLMQESRRLLRPGGIVYLNTPNPDSASFHRLKSLHTHVSSFAHVSLLTKEGLSRVAELAGLELSAHEYCGGIDYALHDAITRPFSSYRHRMARYSPRLHNLCASVDSLTFGLANYVVRPAGNESYHWAALRAPLEG